MPFKGQFKDKYTGSSRERICCPNSVRLVFFLLPLVFMLENVCQFGRRVLGSDLLFHFTPQENSFSARKECYVSPRLWSRLCQRQRHENARGLLARGETSLPMPYVSQRLFRSSYARSSRQNGPLPSVLRQTGMPGYFGPE